MINENHRTMIGNAVTRRCRSSSYVVIDLSILKWFVDTQMAQVNRVRTVQGEKQVYLCAYQPHVHTKEHKHTHVFLCRVGEVLYIIYIYCKHTLDTQSRATHFHHAPTHLWKQKEVLYIPAIDN